jgi:hypothetical protein
MGEHRRPLICASPFPNGTITGDFSAGCAAHNSRVEPGLKVIKVSKTAGFNNPAGRALNRAVDLLEPADAFNISVPNQ